MDKAGPYIGVVIVIYNRLCAESESILTLPDYVHSKVLIIDNSEIDSIIEANREYCDLRNFDYHSFGINRGLAPAYNFAVSYYASISDYLLLLDDDTVLPAGIFDQIIDTACSGQEIDIMVPYVYAGKKLISPCRRRGSLFFRLNSSFRSLRLSKSMSAINSGTVISSKIMQQSDKTYNEDLFLDCIDHDFFIKQFDVYNRYAYIYPAILKQTFFDNSLNNGKNTKELADLYKERYNLFVRDFLIFCRKNKLGVIIPHFYLFFRAVKLSCKMRSFDYFRKLIAIIRLQTRKEEKF